ncbi:MAG: Gfo/Idh/MocA family oxidoreductase [Pirellulaceae bacterium]|nr:Gfo/Idh/MocA family oxidoreductase [Pirellulaceae bacterium]
MNKLNLAVIGCGHLGRIHARLATQLQGADLVAVCDPDPHAREQVARSNDCESTGDFRSLLPSIDAAILAAPTSLHCPIAIELIQHGIHVLVEKPITTDLNEAEKLTSAANLQGVVLAVGHVEQFNPTFAEARKQIQKPRFIEAVRTGGFTFRSTDVGVVFDLMIHDLDLIRSLAGSPVVQTTATGISTLTPHEDFAEARLVFANGCVAHLKASRTSQRAQRYMNVFEEEQAVSIDMGARQASLMSRSSLVQDNSWNIYGLSSEDVDHYKEHVFDQLLPVRNIEVNENNPLLDEQQDFIDSIRQGRQPRVPGSDAVESVRMATDILEQMKRSHANFHRSDRMTIRRAA